MTLILDAGPLVALADRQEPRRAAILAELHAEPGGLVVPAPVTAEVDFILGRRFGRGARIAFLADLAAGRFSVASLDPGDHADALELERRYADLDLGLADCSLVVLAARHSTNRLLSFDERHFRAVQPINRHDGESFAILPADGDR